MASQDNTQKRRRMANPCDICRRQKVRCDSSVMPDGKCTNCKSFNSECTHNTPRGRGNKGTRRVRTEDTDPVVIPEETPQVHSGAKIAQSVSQTVQKESTPPRATTKDIVDGLLREIYAPPPDRESAVTLLLEVSRYARSLEMDLDTSRQAQSPASSSDSGSSTTAISTASLAPESDRGYEQTGEEVLVDIQKLPEHIKRVTLDGADRRFFGKNSSIAFLNAAVKPSGGLPGPRLTRPIYWTPVPWENPPDPPVNYEFPPDDLLQHLVNIYFQQINIFWPILHRPSFEKSLADGLHRRDPLFGAVVLAVCSVASRNSPDPRVLLTCEHGGLSAGWRWFRQIRRPFTGQTVKGATLYELQLCCLYITFQQSCGQYECCWILCGTGILQAQDIGALRARSPDTPPTIEDELIKRVCYYLSIFDSVSSACFGRPRVRLPDDLELPIACDDEWLGHPDERLAFRQPEGRPAVGEFFNAYIELFKIFTMTWRGAGTRQDFTGTRVLEPETLAELDSRLNQWAREIPEHLLWNPYQENDVFFAQSAALYAAFYYVQVLIHRPFIQAKSTSAFRSLAICTNAARSCATVAGVKARRAFAPNYYFVKSVFDCAIVLLLNVSGASKTGLTLDVDRELVDVYKFMEFLRLTESRYQNAGRLYDCLCEVLSASKLPLPPQSPVQLPPAPAPTKPVEELTAAAPGPWPELPMAVEDLSSLPIYESFRFGDAQQDVNMRDISFAEVDAGGLPYQNYTNIKPLSAEMDTDHYLSYWMPYLSTVDGVTQAMQNASSLVASFDS
ncbi:fungal-trans domain-containing protein [Favolaschia claudopus]|uniref:Fungal-trans domain-containing protein n=1 Tax=Favolaschia claudopus TaxID=2862362 RepID=A0AAW0D271_9AGAR